MIETDRGAFDRAFGRVCGAFRLKLSAKDREELSNTYFKVLEPYELPAILAAGRICLETHKRFPTLADWLEVLQAATASAAAPGVPADTRWLTTSEREAYAAAKARLFAGDPCGCPDCVVAGMETRPIRFVPTLTHDGTEYRAYDTQTQTLVIVGHWAHGEELARWYAARAAFFGLAKRSRIPVPAFVPVLAGAREPGEDDE